MSWDTVIVMVQLLGVGRDGAPHTLSYLTLSSYTVVDAYTSAAPMGMNTTPSMMKTDTTQRGVSAGCHARRRCCWKSVSDQEEEEGDMRGYAGWSGAEVLRCCGAVRVSGFTVGYLSMCRVSLGMGVGCGGLRFHHRRGRRAGVAGERRQRERQREAEGREPRAGATGEAEREGEVEGVAALPVRSKSLAVAVGGRMRAVSTGTARAVGGSGEVVATQPHSGEEAAEEAGNADVDTGSGCSSKVHASEGNDDILGSQRMDSGDCNADEGGRVDSTEGWKATQLQVMEGEVGVVRWVVDGRCWAAAAALATSPDSDSAQKWQDPSSDPQTEQRSSD